MAYTGPFLEKCWPLVLKLPAGTAFDTIGEELSVIVQTLDKVRGVTKSFPGSIWQKHWDEYLKWWEYHTVYEGVKIRIYGVKEAPQSCQAITETQLVERAVPVEYETQFVEEEVIVGWDCGGSEQS